MNDLTEKLFNLMDKLNEVMIGREEVGKLSFMIINSSKENVPIAMNIFKIADTIVIVIGGFGVSFEIYEIYPFEENNILKVAERINLIFQYYNKIIEDVQIIKESTRKENINYAISKYMEENKNSKLNEIVATLIEKITLDLKEDSTFNEILKEQESKLKNTLLEIQNKTIDKSINKIFLDKVLDDL